ncbi:ArnT family glycosyltransferase [Nocardioides iriomotensis]|uniref:Glycosyltransferase family 39 protein n=1 Tax=Nocardioides iriomotensis TaxID=715784 RepID=A0A4Q5IYB7_9ACTN|nr:glycosyltransferase family 39 protein [Nocardioides iriomotensis]RYU11003.1 glycosyltransferase family 39 protein [Nocardioides iriomotensis]
MTQTTTLTPRASTAAAPASPVAPGRSHGRAQGGRRLDRVWRGDPGDPPWARPALLVLLVATAALYLWGLSASGWANSFYAAAAQAGSESWKAFFFGSSDAANAITVDKTPASIWVMALSIRLLGLSSWSLLAPQALIGVASVGLLHATVRRTTGSAAAGLLAGTVLALTPVAVLMFRFDNPDALLVLLLIGATAATLKALERNPARWLALAGALVGFAFLTKMLQAFLVLPALALVYLLAAAVPVGKRFLHLLVACGAMVLAGGWWIAIVELWPAASRPYIGGSQTNSILELTLGYNGLGRLTGDEEGSVGGMGGWGTTGLLRMFGTDIGGQVAWLLPASLLLLGAGLWFTRSAERTDRVRAGLVVWGGWLLVTALTFSFMAGIFHAYYTVALAPAIAALVAIGAHLLWQRRDSLAASLVLGSAVAAACGLTWVLLDRTPDYLPWLRWAVVLVGFPAALGLALRPYLDRRLALAAAATALVAVLAAPAAYSVSTAATPHTGSIPSAGPSAGLGGGPMGGGMPGGAMTGRGTPPGAMPGGATNGGLLEGSEPSATLTDLLLQDADSYTWVAATTGSNSASGYQLATEEPVMAIGGFNGSDPSPTLAQFQQYVADGEIHYYVSGGGTGGGPGGMGAGGSTSSDIATWVSENFAAQTVDGVTVYDLSGGVR